MPHPGGWGWRGKLNYFLFEAPSGRVGSLTCRYDKAAFSALSYKERVVISVRTSFEGKISIE